MDKRVTRREKTLFLVPAEVNLKIDRKEMTKMYF